MALATTTETRNTRGRRTASSTRERDDWLFDRQQYEGLGLEMAQAATKQVENAGTYWEKCRSLFVEAQQHNRAHDAVLALFHAGDEVRGRKAPWYRTYKSILTQCADRKIKIDNETGMTQVQKLIKEAKEKEIENDPEAKVAKDEQLLAMLERMVVGCLNRGIDKKRIAEIVKAAQPA